MKELSKFEMEGQQIEIVDDTARADNSEQEKSISANTSNIAAVAANLEHETARAEAAEANISGEIANETARAEAKEAEIEKKADNATAAATSAYDTALPKLNDVTMTNENGVYTLKKTRNGTETEIGTIETSKSNNPVIEVKDTVVENTTSNFDFHTFAETTEDGTENNIGQFYLAGKQITKVAKSTNGLAISYVDQDGTETSEEIATADQDVIAKKYSVDIKVPTGQKIPARHRFKVQLNIPYVTGRRAVAVFPELNSKYPASYVGIKNVSQNKTNSNITDVTIELKAEQDIPAGYVLYFYVLYTKYLSSSTTLPAQTANMLATDALNTIITDNVIFSDSHAAGTFAYVTQIKAHLSLGYPLGSETLRSASISYGDNIVPCLIGSAVYDDYASELIISNAIILFPTEANAGDKYHFVLSYDHEI